MESFPIISDETHENINQKNLQKIALKRAPMNKKSKIEEDEKKMKKIILSTENVFFIFQFLIKNCDILTDM